MARGMRGGRGRGRNDYGDYNMRGDYAENEMANMDMRGDYRGYDMGDMARNDYGYDGHHGGMHGGRAGGYEPVEFMGYCTGYAGAKEDYARGDMGYRNYDMRGRDYGYPMHGQHYPPYDYGYPYDDYGDYGETLSEKELEHWCEKLKKQLDDQEKQMFHKDMISQKAKSMGMQMEGFGEKELEVATLMAYTDYKRTIGKNPDMAIRLGYDWLVDDDVAVKGAEKLATYYFCIVEGEED
jgi:hypothetical protein